MLTGRTAAEREEAQRETHTPAEGGPIRRRPRPRARRRTFRTMAEAYRAATGLDIEAARPTPLRPSQEAPRRAARSRIPPKAEGPPRQEPSRRPWLRLTAAQKLELFILFTVVIIVGMFALRPLLVELGNWGYLGAFIINGISSATVVLPAPGLAAILMVAQDYNPFLLGVATGLGGGLGSLTAYWVGAQGRGMVEGSWFHRLLARAMDRFGAVILLLFSSNPLLPADIASIAAGATRYPMGRYLAYVTVGNVVKMTVVILTFTRSLGWLGDLVQRFL